MKSGWRKWDRSRGLKIANEIFIANDDQIFRIPEQLRLIELHKVKSNKIFGDVLFTSFIGTEELIRFKAYIFNATLVLVQGIKGP